MDWFCCTTQALAFLVTGNDQHARNMIDIAYAWATTNKVFQYAWANGPLNSAWFAASLVKGLELLKYTWQGYEAYKVRLEARV